MDIRRDLTVQSNDKADGKVSPRVNSSRDNESQTTVQLFTRTYTDKKLEKRFCAPNYGLGKVALLLSSPPTDSRSKTSGDSLKAILDSVHASGYSAIYILLVDFPYRYNTYSDQEVFSNSLNKRHSQDIPSDVNSLSQVKQLDILQEVCTPQSNYTQDAIRLGQQWLTYNQSIIEACNKTLIAFHRPTIKVIPASTLFDSYKQSKCFTVMQSLLHEPDSGEALRNGLIDSAKPYFYRRKNSAHEAKIPFFENIISTLCLGYQIDKWGIMTFLIHDLVFHGASHIDIIYPGPSGNALAAMRHFYPEKLNIQWIEAQINKPKKAKPTHTELARDSMRNTSDSESSSAEGSPPSICHLNGYQPSQNEFDIITVKQLIDNFSFDTESFNYFSAALKNPTLTKIGLNSNYNGHLLQALEILRNLYNEPDHMVRELTLKLVSDYIEFVRQAKAVAFLRRRSPPKLIDESAAHHHQPTSPQPHSPPSAIASKRHSGKNHSTNGYAANGHNSLLIPDPLSPPPSNGFGLFQTLHNSKPLPPTIQRTPPSATELAVAAATLNGEAMAVTPLHASNANHNTVSTPTSVVAISPNNSSM